jgi:hypothetical protein
VISTWLPWIAPALFAGVVLFVPGCAVSLSMGARGFDAAGLAPLCSLGVLAFGTLLAPLFGGWGLLPVLVSMVGLSLVGVAGAWVFRRWLDRPVEGESPSAGPATDPSARWWQRSSRSLLWTGSATVAAGLVFLNFIYGVRNPTFPSQTIDAGFHYNAALDVLATGKADGGTVGAASGALSTAWYPPLWHDLAALGAQGTGVNMAITANAVGWAIGGVVWPLSMVWICSRLLPHARLITIFAVGLASGAISLFPYLLLSFGVLWPNVLSLAALPAAVGLVMMLCRVMDRSPHANDDVTDTGESADGAALPPDQAAAARREAVVGRQITWWTILYAGFVGCVGMFFAHPGAIFALGIWVGMSAIIMSARVFAHGRRRGKVALRWSLLGILLAWGVAALLWSQMDRIAALRNVRQFNWPEVMSPSQALGDGLTLSSNITPPHWFFGACAIWGCVRLVRVPRLRWLPLSFAFLVYLWVLDVSSGSRLSQELTGFWYNDPERVAALIPVAAVPLVALGITAALDWLGTTIGRLAKDLRGRDVSPRMALGAACALLTVAAAGIHHNQGIGAGAAVLLDRYTNHQGDQKLVSSSKQQLFEEMPTLLPRGGKVLGSPFMGVQFSRIYSGHDVVIPHLNNQDKPDVELLGRDFKNFMNDKAVCAAVKRENVVAVVEDYERFWPNDARQERFSGLEDLWGTPGLHFKASSGSTLMFTLDDCSKTAG